MTLRSRLAIRFVLGTLFFGMVLFLPAGTLHFWQAWAYLAIWLIPSLGAFVYFYKHDPQMLERRSQMSEQVREQKWIVAVLYVLYLTGMVLPGLDHRFGWSHVPLWLIIASQVIIVAGYAFTLWVLKVNTFAGRTIRVESEQKVISTGPYRLVRHPMYLGMSFMMLSTPLALGSFYALPLFALVIVCIILRLLNEEKTLREQLAGYSDYCLHTRFRLVPHVW
jgi:protein-S-isoprenylcysteine O-methyltransferase Ste14